MKNLRKLSRHDLKDLKGGGPESPSMSFDVADDCHVHYKRNPDGSKGAIVSSGSGPCHTVSGTICETFSSGTDGKCY